MSVDEYGELTNSKETYQEIASTLSSWGGIVIGWTDGMGSHYDILFTYRPVVKGSLQGGLKQGYLFVSIMRMGCFAFDIEQQDTEPSYYGEKLGLYAGITLPKIADLINGVKKELYTKGNKT